MKVHRLLVCLVSMLFISIASSQSTKFRSGIFLHHSTGGCIWGIEGPKGDTMIVPREIAAYNLKRGLTGENAVSLGESWWPLPNQDNEWEKWHRIFENQDADADIRPILDTNRIVVIKSCFPSSEILADTYSTTGDSLWPTLKTIWNYKWHWRSILKAMRQRPMNFFVIWTNAPEVAAQTDDQQAILSDKFCRWAKDTLARGLDSEFGTFPANVYVFDFFHKLAGADGKLPLKYAWDSTDSHPNNLATQLVAPQFVSEVFNAALRYETIGDVDGNGFVQAADAAVVLKYIAGLITVTDPVQLHAMDASKNGTISALDASLILQAAAGLIPPLSGNVADGGLGKGVVMQATGTLEMASPKATTNPEVVKVGIKLSNPVNVYAVQLVSTSDFSLASIDAVNASLPESWQIKWNVVGNQLRIAAAGTTPLPAGDIATIIVHLKNKESRLSFSTEALLNENNQSVGAVEVAGIPTVFALEQNYPNPFNPSTTIRYDIPKTATVSLNIYNTLGQLMAMLVDEKKEPGDYSVQWNANVPSGIYFYRLRAGEYVQTKKMIYLR
jgi:hypothetical protein